MSEQAQDNRLIVLCDGAGCVKAGRYSSYMHASTEGWHLQFEREDGTKHDYCDSCFKEMIAPLQSVTISHEEAQEILVVLYLVLDDDGASDDMRERARLSIDTLETILRN